MKSMPGTYALIMRNGLAATIQVGRWGAINIEPGYYIYVGSAFGPGGVRARVLRHCRKEKARHWHLDYLSGMLSPVRVWCSYQRTKLEHRWAQAVAKMTSVQPIKGFGCSDCLCDAHLFASPLEPNFTEFVGRVGGNVQSYTVSSCL